MKIVNETKYRGADLRKWFLAAHAEMGAPTQKTIYVVYSHRGMAWGCATYSGGWMKITLPGDPAEIGGKGRLAQLLEHEIGHNLGLKHGEMAPGMFRGAARAPGSWEESLELPRLAEEKKATPEDRIAARAAHAEEMAARWEKKLKTAKRTLRKWARKVAYYRVGAEIAGRKKKSAAADIS